MSTSTVNQCPAATCPITQDIMTDPVMTADGHTYEREAIEHWCVPRLAAAAHRSPRRPPPCSACAHGQLTPRAPARRARLESHNTSPLTGLPLSSHVLTPNAQLLAQIQAASASAR